MAVFIPQSQKKALYLSVNVFSTKALIGDTIFASPTGDGTAILRGHPSYAKVQPLRQYLQFSVIFKTLLIGPVPGIEPATSRSVVKRSADWANPAAALFVWTNLGKHLKFIWLCVTSIKTGTRRIMRLGEPSFVIRLERRTMNGSSSGRTMCLLPIFILETHNQTNFKMFAEVRPDG